jgi:hypothetical protein
MMSSYIGSVPGDLTDASRSEADLELERLEREKEARILEKTNERLRDLVPNDEIYEAMENFLLGDPENQIQLLGDPNEILAKADEAKGKGEDLIARAQYETLAKIAIYKQDRRLAQKSLELAGTATNPSDRHANMQKSILANLDQVIRIARDYYKTKEIVTAETEEEMKVKAEAEFKK